MPVSIDYVCFCTPDYLTDHHSREGEVLVGISLQHFTSVEEVHSVFMEELEYSAKPDNFPWEEVEVELEESIRPNLFHQMQHEYELFISEQGLDPEDPDFDEIGGETPYWYFVIRY